MKTFVLAFVSALATVAVFISPAHAGDYEATIERANQYYHSPEYAEKVQAQKAAEDHQYNAQFVRNTYAYAQLHHGLLKPLEITYGDSGWIQSIEISCHDGNDCKCEQYGRLMCSCINRVTFAKHTDLDDDWYLRGARKHRK